MEKPQRRPKSEETKARVVAAAARLFAAHGFEKTTTRAIAAEAGVAHGTLFRYAPTKEDLVEAVFADCIGDALDDAEASAPVDDTFTTLAMHYYQAFVGAYGKDEALARVLVKELPFLQGEAQARQQLLTFRLLAALCAFIDRGLARGDVKDGTTAIVVASLSFGLYYMALVAWLSGQLDKDGAMEFLRVQHLLLEQSWAVSPLEHRGPHERE